MPKLERESRRRALAARLPGLRLVGELDVSHAIVDLCSTIWDDDVVRYVPLNRCTKRDQEVLGVKKAQDFKDYVADTSTTRKFGLALQRRCLAFDIAQLCGYEEQMTVVDRYMELLDGDATAGIGTVSMAQIIRADEALFVELARVCRDGVKGAPGAPSPIGSNIERIFESQRIQLLLVPSTRARELGLQTERPQPRNTPPPLGPEGPLAGKGRRANRRNNRNDPAAPKPKVEPAAADTGKGKGKGKSPSMPAAMLNTCTSKTSGGQSLCFGFNLKSCPHNVRAGERCQRGLHGCAKLKNGVACGGPHAYTDCE